MFQTMTSDNLGIPRKTNISYYDIDTNSRVVPELPVDFTNVKTIILPTKQPIILNNRKITTKNMLHTHIFRTRKPRISTVTTGQWKITIWKQIWNYTYNYWSYGYGANATVFAMDYYTMRHVWYIAFNHEHQRHLAIIVKRSLNHQYWKINEFSPKRIDMVWDVYTDYSFKNGMKSKRGSG